MEVELIDNKERIGFIEPLRYVVMAHVGSYRATYVFMADIRCINWYVIGHAAISLCKSTAPFPPCGKASTNTATAPSTAYHSARLNLQARYHTEYSEVVRNWQVLKSCLSQNSFSNLFLFLNVLLGNYCTVSMPIFTILTRYKVDRPATSENKCVLMMHSNILEQML